MNWLTLITGLAPLVVSLVQAVEAAFAGIRSAGALKKDVVTQGVQAIVTGMETVSTGGQKNTWTAIAGIVSPLIDDAVAVMNAVKPGVVDTTPGTPAAQLGQISSGGQN